MRVTGLTPVAIVEEIEPSLDFFERRLGFERVASVPTGDRMGFVILRSSDGASLMLQSRASVEDDLGVMTAESRPASCVLYAHVESLDPILEALAGAEVAVGERRTSYGAREIFYREPGGHLVGFAEHVSDE